TDFPIARLFDRAERTFAETAREKRLSLRIMPCGAWVRSDAILLERILLNLISNAVRYTAQGGVVVGCRHRGNYIRIDVCDTGPGIPKDQQKDIFGEFYQLTGPDRHRHGGLGLGLAIVERLCRLLGHSMELNSTVGKGSRFSVLLPTAEARSAPIGT